MLAIVLQQVAPAVDLPNLVSAGGQNRPGWGGFKTGHFEGLILCRTRFPAMELEERGDGESAQGGDGAFDFGPSRQIDYLQNNGLKGKSFGSLTEQNAYLLDWETRVANTRIHGTMKKQVGQLFAEVERPALLPLPPMR